MTEGKVPESEMASSPFCDFLSLGAGVTRAQGSVKPTAGFTFNKVISILLVRGAGLEPARYCYHQPLKLACLPFHHPRIVRIGRSYREGLGAPARLRRVRRLLG